MGITGHNWYNLQSTRAYPFDETATLVDDNGNMLPTDVLVDCHIVFPSTLGQYVFVNGLSVTGHQITLTFLATNSEILLSGAVELDDNEPDFQPIAAVTIRKPIDEGRHYDILPLADGVGGWVVLGPGFTNPITNRCTLPKQSLLLPRVARSYTPLPVTSMRKYGVADKLTGVIKLLAGSDLSVTKQTRTIDDVSREVIVLALKTSSDRNVFDLYRGPCSGRPESVTCDRIPLLRVNTISPDCDGDIKLNFLHVTATPYASGVGGISLATPLSSSETCGNARKLPDEDGKLPNEYTGSCYGSSVSESLASASDSSYSAPSFSFSQGQSIGSSGSTYIPSESRSIPAPPSSSVSIGSSVSEPTPDSNCVGAVTLPYVETFDDGAAQGFVVLGGSFSVTNVLAEPSGEPASTWYPGMTGNKVYSATDPSARSIAVWTCHQEPNYYFSPYLTWYGRTAVQFTGGVNRKAGLVMHAYLGSYGGQYTGPYHQYFFPYIDQLTGTLTLGFFNGSGFMNYGSISGLNFQLGHWYEIGATIYENPVYDITSQYRLQYVISVEELDPPNPATAVPYTELIVWKPKTPTGTNPNHNYQISKYWGVGTINSTANFAYFELRTTKY